MLTDGAASYTYSDRGRMASATIGANTVAYKFNGLDQRVSKSGPTAVVPSGAAYYAYDEAGQLIGEYDANVKPGFETIYLGTTPVAVLKQTGSASNSTLQVVAYNVWADHLDTPRVVTCVPGSVRSGVRSCISHRQPLTWRREPPPSHRVPRRRLSRHLAR